MTASNKPPLHRAEPASTGPNSLSTRVMSADGIGVIAIGPDGRITDANDAFCDMSGYAREELVGGGLRRDDLSAPEDREARSVASLEGLEVGELRTFEQEMLRKDGTRWRGHFTPVKIIGSEILGFEIVTDLSARGSMAAALRVSEVRLNAVIEQLPMGVGVTDMSGKWVLRNALIDQYVSDAVPSTRPDQVTKWRSWDDDGNEIPPGNWPAQRALRGETVTPWMDMQYTADDGSKLWMRVSAAPYRLPSGEQVGAVAIVQDVTDLKAFEERSARASRLDAFRIALADAIRPLTDALEIQERAVRLLGEHLGVDRAFYATIEREKGKDYFVLQRGYHAEGATPLEGRYPLDEFSGTIHAEARSGRTIVSSDVENDPRYPKDKLDIYRRLKIRSNVGVSLVKDGRWLGSLGVHHETPREWTAEEIELVEETAERTWAAVERARFERSLTESEGQLRAIYNGTREYVGLAAADGTLLRANRVSLEFAGVPIEEVVGKPLWETVWFINTPGAAQLVKKGFEIALRGAFFRNEMVLRRPNGEERIFDFSLHPIKDETGKVVMVVPEGHDITEIRRAESALRISEERYRGIVNQAVAGVAEVNLRGGFISMNDRFCELTGYTRDQLFDLTVFDITHPDDRDENRKKLKLLIEEGLPFEIEKRYVRPDGSDVWVLNSVNSVIGDDGKPHSIAAFVVDISERKRAERRLRRSETMMTTLVEAAPFGIYFIDADFRLISVNRGASAVFSGIDPLIGRDFAEILREVWEEPFATEAIGHFRHTLETGEPYLAPTATELRAGIEVVESYDWQIHRITMPDGSYGVVCYFYDLTFQKSLEAAVRRTARLDAYRVKLTESLLAATDALEIEIASSRLLGEELNAARVMYFELDEGDYVVEHDYVAGVPSVAGRHSAESFGPKLLEVFRRGQISTSPDTATDERLSDPERAAFVSSGIMAYVGVPLLRDGEFAAGLSVHSATPREWSDEEIALVRETAERTWAAIERVRAEEEVRAIDERLRLAADAAELGTWEWHIDADKVYWNERHFRMMGLEPVDGPVDSAVFFERVHPDDRDELAKELNRSIRLGTVFDASFRIVRNDGMVRWMSGYGKRDESGTLPARVVSGVVLDITDRMNMEEELRESNERLRLLIESATDCSIFTTDRNGMINSWNSGSERIYGYREDEIVGQNVKVLFTEEDRERQMHRREMETALENGRALDERWHLRKDGTRFYASGLTQPLGEGGSEGFVKIARDMTERIRTEQARREKELLQTLVGAQEDERKRIARDLHDELGQQLTALRLKLDAMRDSVPQPLTGKIGEVQEIARSIDEGVDFLAWELRPAALDDLGLVDAIAKYVKEWSHYSGVHCTLHAAGLNGRRFGTEIETALYRIVQEGLNNVNKHANASAADVTLRLRGSELLLIVDDDGEGFDLEDSEKRRNGIGLIGMSERVQILGGSLEIESHPNQGTTLFVRVPVR